MTTSWAPPSLTVEVYGVREALAELRKLSPEARREAVSKVKAASGPLVAEARKPYPGFTPLRGWGAGQNGGRLGYVPSKVAKGVQVQVGGRTPRGADSFPVVTLIQRDAGGALFDIAGLRGGSRPGRNGPNPTFIRALEANYGKAQRGMWRNIRQIREIGYQGILAACNEVAAAANRRLV